jgi:hypothetical protein
MGNGGNLAEEDQGGEENGGGEQRKEANLLDDRQAPFSCEQEPTRNEKGWQASVCENKRKRRNRGGKERTRVACLCIPKSVRSSTSHRRDHVPERPRFTTSLRVESIATAKRRGRGQLRLLAEVKENAQLPLPLVRQLSAGPSCRPRTLSD